MMLRICPEWLARLADNRAVGPPAMVLLGRQQSCYSAPGNPDGADDRLSNGANFRLISPLFPGHRSHPNPAG